MLAILVLGPGHGRLGLLIVFVASLVAVLRERPSPKHFGPLLLVWGLAMLMLIFIRDLGSSLMFFGGFLCCSTWPPTGCRWSAWGRRCSSAGRSSSRRTSRTCNDRVQIWLDTFSQERGVCPPGRVTEFVNCQGY